MLSEYSAYSGNFHSVAQECLSSMTRLEERFTIAADRHTFNFLTHNGYIYLAVADEAYGRAVPFGFLERIRDAFEEKFASTSRTAAPHSLDRTFGSIMKRQMEYCVEHPEEVSKMAGVQRKVDEVKSIMLQNVESVLARGEKLDVLVDHTDSLRDQAQKFQKQGQTLRKKMWWQNMKVKLIVVAVIILLIVVIFLLSCFTGGRNCVSKDSPAPAVQSGAAPPGVTVGPSAPLNEASLVPGTVPPSTPLPDATLVPGSAPTTVGPSTPLAPAALAPSG